MRRALLVGLWKSLCATGSFLHEAGRAHAHWELETSRTILRRKRLLFALLIPILLATALEMAWAALPDTLGGHKAYSPSFATSAMFLLSIIIGFLAGLITGVIGAGGGYILTPALMSFGVKGIMAVGTDQFHLFAKAIMGTTIHRKLGNVSLGLAVWFVVGSTLGVYLGATLNRTLYHANPALNDAFISVIYTVLLGALGAFALADWLRMNRKQVEPEQGQQPAKATFAQRMQQLYLPPHIHFDRNFVPGGRRISIYPVVLIGFCVGAFAAIIGVGGGFLAFPMFVYGLGVSTFTTVGTNLLQVMFTTAYSSIFHYAFYGFIFYTIAMGMLLGSLLGVQIGALVTTLVKGVTIRAFYALTILAGFFNRLAALPRRLTDAGYLHLNDRLGRIIELSGVVVFFVLVGIFGLWILHTFFTKLGMVRAPLPLSCEAVQPRSGGE